MPSNYGDRVFGDSQLGGISNVVTSLNTPSPFALGEIRYDNNIKFRLFYNDGGDQIQPGYCFKAKGGGQSVYSVTITTVAGDSSMVMGVVLHATAVTGTYFWGAVHGYPCKVAASNVSLGTGDWCFPAGTVGQWTKTTTTSSTVPYCAYNVGDAATGATALTNLTASGTKTGSRFYVMFEDKPNWALPTG